MTATADSPPNAANLAATPILDYEHPDVRALAAKLHRAGASPRELVQIAHTHLMTGMRAVYSIDDARPVSVTIQKNDGSCAQRMALVEALARAWGVPTRVRALWLDRKFWFHRLPKLRRFLPQRTLMPWPQFHLEGRWVDFDEVYGTIAEMAARSKAQHAFTNKGQSLYDAVSNTAVDFFGKLKGTPHAKFDLTEYVAGDGGYFDTRDEVMEKLEPKRSAFGVFIFNRLYGGKDIRRQPE